MQIQWSSAILGPWVVARPQRNSQLVHTSVRCGESGIHDAILFKLSVAQSNDGPM
jgi:hypothetical protein